MTRPSRDVVLMQTAAAFAERSTCARAHVGAVFSRDGRILATGYNGAPAGMAHCKHSQEYEGFHEGKGCDVSVHAEANGIAWAARLGVALEGCEVHTTLSPCVKCAQLLINAGVVRVTYLRQYRDYSGLALLTAAEIVHGLLHEFP